MSQGEDFVSPSAAQLTIPEEPNPPLTRVTSEVSVRTYILVRTGGTAVWFDYDHSMDRLLRFQEHVVVSAAITAAALSIWVVRGRAPAWIRYSVLIGVVGLLAIQGASELLIYLIANTSAVAALQSALVNADDPVAWSGAWKRRYEVLGFAAVLACSAVVAVSLPGLHKGTWLAIGIAAGCGAAVIDLGARTQRYWIPKLVFATILAVLFVGFAVAMAKEGEPLGTHPSDSSFFAFSLLVVGMIFYGFWRMLKRLAVRPNSESAAHVPDQAAGSVPASFASTFKSVSRRLGVGSRRALRILVVWPLMIWSWFYFFTPWLECYFRMPSITAAPAATPHSEAFEQLQNLAKRVQWPMMYPEDRTAINGRSLVPFATANRPLIPELRKLLAEPIVVPIDYTPLAIDFEERETFDDLSAVLIGSYAEAAFRQDANGQFEAVYLLLQLIKPLRQSALSMHTILGRNLEGLAFYMAYVSRDVFSPQQYKDLVQLLGQSGNWLRPIGEIGKTVDQWRLATRGWRERLEIAVDIHDGDHDSLSDYEIEHDCARATLICELALQQYRNDHGDFPEELDALVPNYLARLPIDPFSGLPLAYHRPNDYQDLFFVFSVGDNQVHDERMSDQRNFYWDDISVALRARGQDRIDPLPNYDLPWEIAERQGEADDLLSEPDSEMPAGDDNGI